MRMTKENLEKLRVLDWAISLAEDGLSEITMALHDAEDIVAENRYHSHREAVHENDMVRHEKWGVEMWQLRVDVLEEARELYHAKLKKEQGGAGKVAGNLEPGVQVSFWIDQKRYRGTFIQMQGPRYVLTSESLRGEVWVNAADIIWGTQQTPGAEVDYSGSLDDIGNQSDKYKAERDALQLKVAEQKSMLEYLRDKLESLSGEIVIVLQEDE